LNDCRRLVAFAVQVRSISPAGVAFVSMVGLADCMPRMTGVLNCFGLISEGVFSPCRLTAFAGVSLILIPFRFCELGVSLLFLPCCRGFIAGGFKGLG
jgi:hypothetical protein